MKPLCLLLSVLTCSMLYGQGTTTRIDYRTQVKNAPNVVADSNTTYTTFAQACTGAAGKTLVLGRVWTSVPSQTCAAAIQFVAGGLIRPAANQTVTLSGSISCLPYQQCFDTSASGAVVAFTHPPPDMAATWWGADSTGVADSVAAIRSCFIAGTKCNIWEGGYKTLSLLTMAGSGKSLVCASRITTLKYAGAAIFSPFVVGTGATGTNNVTVANCFFDANAAVTGVTGAALYNSQADSNVYTGVGVTNAPIGFLTESSVGPRIEDFRCSTSAIVQKCLSLSGRIGSGKGTNSAYIVNPGILGNGTGTGIALDWSTGATITGGFINSIAIGVDIPDATNTAGGTNTVISGLDVEAAATKAYRIGGDFTALLGPSYTLSGDTEILGTAHGVTIADGYMIFGTILVDSGASGINVDRMQFTTAGGVGIYLTDNSGGHTVNVHGNVVDGVIQEDYDEGIYNAWNQFSTSKGCPNCTRDTANSLTHIVATFAFSRAVITPRLIDQMIISVAYLNGGLTGGAANDLNFAGTGAKAIKSKYNVVAPIVTSYAGGGNSSFTGKYLAACDCWQEQ